MKKEVLVLGELDTNTYLIASEQGHCAIVDPAAEVQAIVRTVESRGFTPAYLLVTHCHHDHIGAVKELQERWNVPVVMSKADYDILANPERFNARYQRNVEGKQFTVDRFVADGDEIVMDELTFRVLATPGHTVGGVCYLCGTDLYAGDTLFKGTVGRCDLYSGDFTAMLASTKRLAALPGDYDVYPGHGPATTLETERRGNPYINGTYLEMDDY